MLQVDYWDEAKIFNVMGDYLHEVKTFDILANDKQFITDIMSKWKEPQSDHVVSETDYLSESDFGDEEMFLPDIMSKWMGRSSYHAASKMRLARDHAASKIRLPRDNASNKTRLPIPQSQAFVVENMTETIVRLIRKVERPGFINYGYGSNEVNNMFAIIYSYKQCRLIGTIDNVMYVEFDSTSDADEFLKQKDSVIEKLIDYLY